MKKATITRIWIGGLVTFAAGIVLALFGVFFMLAFGGTFAQVGSSGNYNFTPDYGSGFWSTIGVIVFGGIVVVVGGIVQLAAWIAALVNSYLLTDKAWFIVLLVAGLLSFAFAPLGFAAMIAYVVAAPDGSEQRPATPAPLPPQGAMAPSG